MRHLLLFYVVSFFGVFAGFSQEDHPYIVEMNKRIQQGIDSLDQFPKQDTLRVMALQNIYIKAVFKSQMDQVIPYANEARKLSKKLDYKSGLCYYYIWKGRSLTNEKRHSDAVQYFDSIYDLKPPYPKSYDYYCGFAEQMKGEIYENQENYYTALGHLFLAIKHYKKSAELSHLNELHILSVYRRIAQIYLNIESLDNASYYCHLILKAIETESFSLRGEGADVLKGYKSMAELLLSDIYIKQKKYDAALTILKHFKKSAEFDPGYFNAYNYNQKIGEIFFIKKNYDSAHFYFKDAHKVAMNFRHGKMLNTALYSLTQSSIKLGKLEDAKSYAEENMAMSQTENNLVIKLQALTGFSNYLNAIGNSKEAYNILSEAIILKDSLISETNLKQINTLNAIYQSEQNKESISKLNVANQKKATFNNILIGSSAALLLISFLIFRNFKHKRNVQTLKISQLEKDKQLLTVDGMLRGQEEERSRIAKDLHDGLGGLLSGTKLSFTNMKENLVLTPENAIQFDNSLSMLDSTIVDLRKVAQNLMPEALVKFGLNEALRDFCNTIQLSSKITVDYQKLGSDRKLNNTAEVFVYRIVQELVNNAIKHAKATEIFVQLALSEAKTLITVEDNGIGYDKNNIKTKKGSGLDNIEYRVSYLNGVIETETSINNGTTVNIELHV